MMSGMTEPRLIICGDRDWVDWTAIVRTLEPFPRTTLIINGRARGADEIAWQAAKAMGFSALVPYPANWDKHHLAAGPIRNREMLAALLGGPREASRYVIGFHDDISASKGTKNMLSIARKAAKKPENNLSVRLISHKRR